MDVALVWILPGRIRVNNRDSQFCWDACSGNRSLFQCDWHIRGQRDHSMNFTLANTGFLRNTRWTHTKPHQLKGAAQEWDTHFPDLSLLATSVPHVLRAMPPTLVSDRSLWFQLTLLPPIYSNPRAATLPMPTFPSELRVSFKVKQHVYYLCISSHRTCAELCYQFLLPTLKKRVTNEGFEYCVLSLTLSSPISPVVLVEQLHTLWWFLQHMGDVIAELTIFQN